MMTFNFSEKPFLVIWETTRACDLACVHCRAAADPNPGPNELTAEEGRRVVEEVRNMGAPILIFSGGDPFKRKDLSELIAYAKSLGLRTGAIPAATPALTSDRFREMGQAGLDQIAFSLDAATESEHDAFRRVEGVFGRTLRGIREAQVCGLKVQINSLINVHNYKKLPDLINLVESLGIVFWEIFFLIPTGRGEDLELMKGEDFEAAFESIYELARRAGFIIKVTEAPHYRRFFYEKEMERQGVPAKKAAALKADLPADLIRLRRIRPAADSTQDESAAGGKGKRGPHGSIGLAPAGVNSGKGFLFISFDGTIMPSGFLPLPAGNIRTDSLRAVYQNSPLFKNLRDTSLLKGRCGICPYKEMCGGSRARAFAMTGDYLAEDPCCIYEPKTVPTDSRGALLQFHQRKFLPSFRQRTDPSEVRRSGGGEVGGKRQSVPPPLPSPPRGGKNWNKA